MKNTTILFGLVVLYALLSVATKKSFNKINENNNIVKNDPSIGTSNSIISNEQLPIIDIKRD
ncbi:hypothetical protein NHF50_06455 [Flavobacterium sp. NRK F10]|uniref:hypothetical protein n=1 Tax=Flavobacterium sp. NRK F10 TaxID=2954931 RepID=UPI002090BFDD|nr:hypothetical protein [Flavobacterium sp. NRK F10]MCO6174682.1 hypothetical protein [Flavobacterium sp. NRK F10]